MRIDFTPDNVEIWIDNWKRKEVINFIAKSWLDSFPFEKINFIVNHSSVTIEDFDLELRSKIKIWNNVMRHDLSRGPITRNINQSYIHTFLAKKKYCIFAHDSYYALKGWDEIIKNTNYDFYSSPQGDGFHVMLLDGLKKYGWWDERYSSLGWHEIDFLTRVLRADIGKNYNSASIVDIHEIWGNLGAFTNRNCLYYNDCNLQQYIKRFEKNKIVQLGASKNSYFDFNSKKWHYKKWKFAFSPESTFLNIQNGPMEDEIDWYPWLNLNELDVDATAY